MLIVGNASCYSGGKAKIDQLSKMIDGAPQVAQPPIHSQIDFIQAPLKPAHATMLAIRPVSIFWPKLLRPAMNSRRVSIEISLRKKIPNFR